MTPIPCNADQYKALLRLAIDDGTGEMKVAGQFFPAHSTTSKTATPFTIRLKGQLSVSQKVVLEGNLDEGHLIWGDRDVNQWRRHNPRQANRVCQLWKLALSEDYRDTPTGRAVFKAIGAEHGNMETYEEFVTKRFRLLHTLIIDRLVNNHSKLLPQGVDARHYWENEVQIETLLMCPAKWSQDAQSIMVAAATDAGFTNVGIVYESLVAVASEVHRLEENGHVQEGDVIVVFDIGRGTLDISTATIERSTRILKLVGDYSTCGMAGSQLVNEYVWEYVQSCREILQHGKDIHEMCTRMGHSIEEFQLLVSDEVELRKTDFPDRLDYQLTIRSRVGHGDLPFILIDISYEKMQEFFDGQVKEITRLLDEHLLQHDDHSIHGAIATGGGAKNQYVRERLDEYFEKRIGRRCQDGQEQHPICHGALQHYPQNHAQALPTGVLYICRGEEYDKRIHSDVSYGTGKIKRNMIKQDGCQKRTRMDWVEDRLTTIMSKRDGKQPIGRRVVMIFNVLASNPGRIKFPLFHSTDSRKEHQAAYSDDGKPQEDLAKWTVRFVNLTGDFAQHRFPSNVINGQECHIVTTIVSIEGDETHLDLVLQVITAEELQFDESGQARADVDYPVLIEKRMEVWDRYRSYFPMKDEAVSGEPAMDSNHNPAQVAPTVPSMLPPPSSAAHQHKDLTHMEFPGLPDSGVSLSSTSRLSSPEPGLFVNDEDDMDDSDYTPAPAPSRPSRGKLIRPRRSLMKHSQHQRVSSDSGEDALFGPPTPLKRRNAQVMQPTGPALKKTKLLAEAMNEDEDDEENITVTPRPWKKREVTPPGQDFSPDAREGIEMAGDFLRTFESPEEERLMRQ